MVWLFLLGIIWLAVIHEGFRKVTLWVTGIGAAGLLLLFMILASNPHFG